MTVQLYPTIIECMLAACELETHSRECMCAVALEDRLDDPPPSPGDCVEPASRGRAAITTSWALSGRWPTLYSTRPATLTDGRTESMTGAKTGGRKDKRRSMWIFYLPTESEELAVSLQAAENRKKP